MAKRPVSSIFTSHRAAYVASTCSPIFNTISYFLNMERPAQRASPAFPPALKQGCLWHKKKTHGLEMVQFLWSIVFFFLLFTALLRGTSNGMEISRPRNEGFSQYWLFVGNLSWRGRCEIWLDELFWNFFPSPSAWWMDRQMKIKQTWNNSRFLPCVFLPWTPIFLKFLHKSPH